MIFVVAILHIIIHDDHSRLHKTEIARQNNSQYFFETHPPKNKLAYFPQITFSGEPMYY